MTVILLAALLSAAGPETGPAPLEEQPFLSIDPCVGADTDTVSDLLEIELGPAAALGAAGPWSIAVRCLDDGEEIRVEPWASLAPDGVRLIQLPAVEASDPAARQGRSRELALAIAELVRRLQTTRPLTHAEAPPPPAAGTPLAVTATPAPPQPPDRWLVGARSAADHFQGGELLIGADLVAGARLGRWLTAELTAGGRTGQDPASTVGRLSERAAAGSAAVGLLLRRHTVGVGLALRVEGFLVELRAELPSGAGSRSVVRGAVALAAEPQLSVAVSPHVWLQAAAGAGSSLHGILVRQNGLATTSLTGIFASGSFGAVVTF